VETSVRDETSFPNFWKPPCATKPPFQTCGNLCARRNSLSKLLETSMRDEKPLSKLLETSMRDENIVSKLLETFVHVKKTVSKLLETFITMKTPFPNFWKHNPNVKF
jgi:hypothetical protein